jgi:phosphoribosylformimino-5-aminoimidazole carboxamide ribotide isomerase
LSRDARPVSVLAGLLRRFTFRTVYVADLDALMGKNRQDGVIRELTSAFPGLEFWVDRGWPAGIADVSGGLEGVAPVIGSESLDESQLEILAGIDQQWILSLDFREERIIGPEIILNRSLLWPETVILMNLSRVGSSAGPDTAGARAFIRNHPGHRWIAAGGVRDEADLQALMAAGVAGVLVASALHSGAIRPDSLRRYLDPHTGIPPAR